VLIVYSLLLVLAFGKNNPTPARKNSPYIWRTHVVAKGETLQLIAMAEYHDASKWQLIYELNRNSIDGHSLHQGQVLRIRVRRKNLPGAHMLHPSQAAVKMKAARARDSIGASRIAETCRAGRFL
jgi:LysM repeat protein